jgi:glycosidase
MKLLIPRGASVCLCAFLLLAGPALRAGDVHRPQARSSPQWLRDGVIYEIFERDFSPAGDFNGITARLDELKDLGVNVLWLMPVHPIGEKLRKGTLGSPYAVRDYYTISPEYGTAADLKRLVAEAHQRGLKVILDVVLDHTAWDCTLMAHPEFYKRDASGNILPPVKEWTDVAGLDYDNPGLRDYMIQMLKHWVEPAGFDLDGFRCDVAEMVPTSFWEEARAELEKVKPDIMMLAEASKPELLVKAFDTDYSWPLLGAVNGVLSKGSSASEIEHCWVENRLRFPVGALHMRMSDDHDESRAVARFGAEGALAASVLMFTLDGVPMLYNGMEVGDATESGDPALFEKLPIFWHPKDRPPFRDIYRGLIRLRRQYPAFRNDQVTWLRNSDAADLLTFMREDAQDQFLVAINLSNRPVSASVEIPHPEGFVHVSIPGESGSSGGCPQFRLNGFDWQILHHTVERTQASADH